MRLLYFILPTLLCGCVAYHSPSRDTWSTHLRGASLTDMTVTSRAAKRPVYMGAGGKIIDSKTNIEYMSKLEYELYDALRKPGISVQRAGTDVIVILVRDAIMELNAPEISETGDDTLNIISTILNKYDATFIEIAGYTDSMRNTVASDSLSMDMAQRVGVYMAKHGILTVRMFIVGRGASRPIAAQDDMGRLTNRRIEIRISPVI